MAGQFDGTVARAPQAAHFEAGCLPGTPHLAVAAPVRHHPELTVVPGAVLAGLGADQIEAGRPVFESYAPQEALNDLRPRPPTQPHQVLALDLARGMHQAMGQLAVRGEEQEPGSVDVQSPHSDPASAARRGQSLEHGGPVLRVAPGSDLPYGLIVKE
jgi:hypothetical protein